MGKIAFQGSRQDVYLVDPNLCIVIGLDTQDGPDHPLFDERIHHPLVEATVLDMMAHGVSLPLIVRSTDDDRPIVVDGRRRVMHAREANRRLVAAGQPPIRVPVRSPLKGTDADAVSRMIALNELREEDTAIGRARKAKKLQDFGYSNEEIAGIFGVSDQTIAKILSLLDLAPELVQQLTEQRLTLTQAYYLAAMDPDDQIDVAASLPTPRKTRKKSSGAEVVARAPRRKALLDLVATNPGGWPEATVIGVSYAAGLLSLADADAALARLVRS